MAKKDNKIGVKVDAIKYVEEHGYPEVGLFAEKKALQKFYKQLEMAQIDEWVALEGLEYKESDSEPINRMRACMAILYKHFPKEPSKKKESPYKAYTTEQLIEMAIDNSVEVEPTEDMRIMRMRTIMALREAKVIG